MAGLSEFFMAKHFETNGEKTTFSQGSSEVSLLAKKWGELFCKKFSSGRRAEVNQGLDPQSFRLGKSLKLYKSQFLIYKMGVTVTNNGIV